MQKPFFYKAFLWLVVSSCKITAGNIIGTYQQKDGTSSRLILKEDKSFEYAGPGVITVDSAISVGSYNFLTTGTWKFNNGQLWLNSFPADSMGFEKGMTDSIARFTSITSFNFWNRYGDPVSVRSIRLPASRPKPHFGNSLYLFAQDFKATDTVKFYFEAYPDFAYPGSIPFAIGNNTHKITLREPYRPSAFNNARFTFKRNKLFVAAHNLAFTKKK